MNSRKTCVPPVFAVGLHAKGFCDDAGAAGGLAKRSSNKLVLSDGPRGGSAPGIVGARGKRGSKTAGCCGGRFANRSSIVFLSSTSTSDTIRALWPKAPRASVRANRPPNESSRLGADTRTEEAVLCTLAWLVFRAGWLTRVRRSSASSRVGGRGRCSVTSVVAPCAPASGFGALGALARSRRSRPISALAASSVFTSDASSGPWQTSATSEPECRGDHACGADGRFAKRSSKVCLSSTSDTVRAPWPKAPRASARANRPPNASSRLGAGVSTIASDAVNAAAVPSSGLALTATFLLIRVATSLARLPTPFQKLVPSESAMAARTPSRSFHSRR
jgi:hypothetical protein